MGRAGGISVYIGAPELLQLDMPHMQRMLPTAYPSREVLLKVACAEGACLTAMLTRHVPWPAAFESRIEQEFSGR